MYYCTQYDTIKKIKDHSTIHVFTTIFTYYGYKARGKTVNSCIPIYINNMFHVRVN